MPFHFDFDPVNKISRCQFEGRVTDLDFRKFYADAADFVGLTNPRAALVDFSAVTSFEVSPQTIHELANSPPALRYPERPRVFLAPAPSIFGMLRMFEIVGERARPNFHVVSAERDAWAILGVKEPRFAPFQA